MSTWQRNEETMRHPVGGVKDPVRHMLSEWRRIAVLTAVGAVISAIVAMALPRYYSSDVLIMPPGQSSNSQVISQLASLAGMAAGSAGKTTEETYVAFLKSRRISNGLISRFDLVKRYGVDDSWDALSILEDRVSIAADKKSGLIRIGVLDPDPRFAAELANGLAQELRRLLSEIAVTEAQRRRKFYEQQVADAKKVLAQAEGKLQSIRQEKGIFANEAIAEASIAAGLGLRQRILERSTEVEARARFLTPDNMEYKAARAELEALKNQLRDLESGSRAPASASSPQGQEAVAALREIRVARAALDALTMQYGVAKLDEAREGGALQIIDAATPSKIPSHPKRKLIVLVGTLLAFILSLAWAAQRGGLNMIARAG